MTFDPERPTTPEGAADTILYFLLVHLDAWGMGLASGADWAISFWNHDGPAYRNRQKGLPYDPAAWLDHQLTQADRQRFSRGLKILEERGQVEAVASGGRARFLRPTPAGLQAAIALVRQTGAEPGFAAILKALETTDWARPPKPYLEAIAAEVRRLKAATRKSRPDQAATEERPTP